MGAKATQKQCNAAGDERQTLQTTFSPLSRQDTKRFKNRQYQPMILGALVASLPNLSLNIESVNILYIGANISFKNLENATRDQQKSLY